MLKIKNPFLSAVLNGVITLLPILIIIIFYRWVWQIVLNAIAPIMFILDPQKNQKTFFIALISLIIVILFCYSFGIYLKTLRNQKNFFNFENKFFQKIPGYNLAKQVIGQIFFKNKKSFSEMAIVNTFGTEIEQIAFITDRLSDGRYVVFVPTGPNPTSGNIYILSEEFVRVIDVHMEKVMRTVVGCGMGAKELMDEVEKVDIA